MGVLYFRRQNLVAKDLRIDVLGDDILFFKKDPSATVRCVNLLLMIVTSGPRSLFKPRKLAKAASSD